MWCRPTTPSSQRSAFKFCNKLNNVFLVFSRCHPGTLGDAGVRLLQLQLGERAHQPQRHRALLWRERQAAALLRHVEERLRDRRGRQARLLAGRRQLLRQVRYCDRTWRSWCLRRTPARQFSIISGEDGEMAWMRLQVVFAESSCYSTLPQMCGVTSPSVNGIIAIFRQKNIMR